MPRARAREALHTRPRRSKIKEMRRTSYYLILIIAVGTAIVSFWVYQKYFRSEEAQVLFFKVERGNIQEIVKVRGEVAAQKDFDLEFPFSGTIEKIYVVEGRLVEQGALLMKLETIDLGFEKQRLEAVLAQKKTALEKLIAGPTAEDIRVAETKEANAAVSLEDAKRNLLDKLRDAYTKSDDAVRNKVDQFFSNPRGSSPQTNFYVYDSQLELTVESGRLSLEGTLTKWKASLDTLTSASDLDSYLGEARTNLDLVASFLNSITLALSPLSPSAAITQTTIDTWRADVYTGRTNVNTALTNLSSAEEKLRSAESALQLAQDELILKKSGTRPEDIEIAKAQVREIENQIAATEEKIRKSALRAPAGARVAKIWLETGEVFTPGQPAASLSTPGHKIQSDVSELEIGKIREVDGNDVLIRLDAFPDLEFRGKVVSIDPQEVVKDEDIFYRVNIYFEARGTMVRPGMNADLTILVSSKDKVLKIPALAVYEKDGKKFVKILEGKKEKEIEIETGITDGESIEVISGLSEGQTVVVSAD